MTAASDMLCMAVLVVVKETSIGQGDPSLWVGKALDFEHKRAWSWNSEPFPTGEIMLLLQDPTQSDSCLLASLSQRECTFPFTPPQGTRHRG